MINKKVYYMKKNPDEKTKKTSYDAKSLPFTKKFFSKLDSKFVKKVRGIATYFWGLENLDDDGLKTFKLKKDKIVMIVGAPAGIFLIFCGVFLFSAPYQKGFDNVIFGEKAMFSVFLILFGVLILSATLAHRVVNKTFLKKIDKELEKEGKNNKN